MATAGVRLVLAVGAVAGILLLGEDGRPDDVSAELPGINGKFVYTDTESLWVLDPTDPSNPIEIIPGTSDTTNRQPHWSPDGQQVVFERVGTGGDDLIMVAGADGGDEFLVTNGFAPDWSPDGQRIIHVRDDGNLWTIRLDGTGLQQLTSLPGDEFDAVYSPDGSMIAFCGSSGGEVDLFVMNADGSGLENLTNFQEEYRSPDWKPDGESIVFYSGRDDLGGTGGVFSIGANGSGLIRLGPGNSPSVSPDGLRVSYTRGAELYHASAADGSDEVLVASLPHSAAWPDWQRIPGPYDEAVYLPGGARQ